MNRQTHSNPSSSARTGRKLGEAERVLLARFAGSAPRYTSYPTAPQFTADVGVATYRDWLSRNTNTVDTGLRATETGDEPSVQDLSLYAHVPFCGTLCWFCACRSQGARNYDLITRYLGYLFTEIDAVADLSGDRVVRHLHWGGGSPTILSPDDIVALAKRLRQRFNFAPNAEFAVEIDPRDMTADRLDALADAGVTRASLGVQDFNPEVQAAINREQSFESTQAVIHGLRDRGVTGVNIDALYGLPHQSIDRLAKTLDGVLALDPDRIALFGYAHVPWMAKRQTLIDDDALPDSEERFEQAAMAAEILVDAGYRRVGLDHFAKPDDALARAAADGRLRRNFQGYTTDAHPTLLGLGASAITRTPYGYAQNQASTAAYQKAVEETGLATARGVSFTMDDRIRAAAIERLMCDCRFDGDALRAQFGDLAGPVVTIARSAVEQLPAGVVAPTASGFDVTDLGRPFVRNIATLFDRYFQDGEARYSRAV